VELVREGLPGALPLKGKEVRVLDGELKPPQNCETRILTSPPAESSAATYLDFILIDKPSASLHSAHQSSSVTSRTNNTHGKVQSVMSECRGRSEQGDEEGVGEHDEWNRECVKRGGYEETR
jgi:hypothetical protein